MLAPINACAPMPAMSTSKSSMSAPSCSLTATPRALAVDGCAAMNAGVTWTNET